MDRAPVSSTLVRSVGYDADSRVLEVELLEGQVYRYRDVSPFIYEGLLAAKSKGAFFSKRIASRFPSEQLRVPRP